MGNRLLGASKRRSEAPLPYEFNSHAMWVCQWGQAPLPLGAAFELTFCQVSSCWYRIWTALWLCNYMHDGLPSLGLNSCCIQTVTVSIFVQLLQILDPSYGRSILWHQPSERYNSLVTVSFQCCYPCLCSSAPCCYAYRCSCVDRNTHKRRDTRARGARSLGSQHFWIIVVDSGMVSRPRAAGGTSRNFMNVLGTQNLQCKTFRVSYTSPKNCNRNTDGKHARVAALSRLL